MHGLSITPEVIEMVTAIAALIMVIVYIIFDWYRSRDNRKELEKLREEIEFLKSK